MAQAFLLFDLANCKALAQNLKLTSCSSTPSPTGRHGTLDPMSQEWQCIGSTSDAAADHERRWPSPIECIDFSFTSFVNSVSKFSIYITIIIHEGLVTLIDLVIMIM